MEIAREFGGVVDAAEHDIVNPADEHAEHRLGIAMRVAGFEVPGEQIDERSERGAQFARRVLP